MVRELRFHMLCGMAIKKKREKKTFKKVLLKILGSYDQVIINSMNMFCLILKNINIIYHMNRLKGKVLWLSQ